MRFASLCLVAIARAVTYSFQVSSQAVTTVAGQLDRFVYTCECLFPLIMVIDILASKKIEPEFQPNLCCAIQPRRDIRIYKIRTTAAPDVGCSLTPAIIAFQ
ncbi:hypothetical protein AWENTII_009539 [Aspergillus wentii]